MKPQDIVSKAVRERGYYNKPDGSEWTKEQLASRQVAKLVEELDELANQIGVADLHYDFWAFELEKAAISATRHFNDSDEWGQFANTVIFDEDKAAIELADIQVVVFTLADALGVDVAQLAVDKAQRDIERGVRNEG